MGKNIIICCDGTSNDFGDRPSNVVRLFTVLEKVPGQVVYYDPGVGTSRPHLAQQDSYTYRATYLPL